VTAVIEVVISIFFDDLLYYIVWQ